jgi:hypothetical protein
MMHYEEFDQGRSLIDQGKYPEAIAAFTRTLDINPRLALAFNCPGWPKEG